MSDNAIKQSVVEELTPKRIASGFAYLLGYVVLLMSGLMIYATFVTVSFEVLVNAGLNPDGVTARYLEFFLTVPIFALLVYTAVRITSVWYELDTKRLTIIGSGLFIPLMALLEWIVPGGLVI